MAFLNKKVLRNVSDKTAPTQDEGQSGCMIDIHTRQAYLEGCILAVKKNGGLDSDDAKHTLDAVGRLFQIGKEDIIACYDVVSGVSDSEENEFIDEEIVSTVKSAGLELRFLLDVETCASETTRIGAAAYTLIYRYAEGLSVDKNTWRVQVLDLVDADKKRKCWINCCRQAAKVWSAHDAQYALAHWHFSGIDVGLNDAEAESLYEQAAKQGNAEAQKAVDAIKTKRAEEERISAEKEAKRRAEEERKRAKEEAEAKRRAEAAEAKRRKKIKDGIAAAAPVGVVLLVIIFGVWFVCHLHNKKVERINTAANSIMQSMVSIPGAKFKIGKTEVTQAQWYGIMGKNPSKNEGWKLPVENVSWKECQEFIEKLNKSDAVKKSQIKRFRLPTEKEWEYACRAGGTGDIGLMADGQQGRLDEMAWYNCGSTHPVATKKPNAYGLYDMHGNVFEWCSDVKKGFLYDSYVNKGGAYDKSAERCYASSQDDNARAYGNTGLRVVCD